jgi:hypothetical protein
LLSAQHFRQGLASDLHFRQWEVPKYNTALQIESQNRWIFVYLRQVIASSRGKELLQVTTAAAV